MKVLNKMILLWLMLPLVLFAQSRNSRTQAANAINLSAYQNAYAETRKPEIAQYAAKPHRQQDMRVLLKMRSELGGEHYVPLENAIRTKALVDYCGMLLESPTDFAVIVRARDSISSHRNRMTKAQWKYVWDTLDVCLSRYKNGVLGLQQLVDELDRASVLEPREMNARVRDAFGRQTENVKKRCRHIPYLNGCYEKLYEMLYHNTDTSVFRSKDYLRICRELRSISTQDPSKSQEEPDPFEVYFRRVVPKYRGSFSDGLREFAVVKQKSIVNRVNVCLSRSFADMSMDSLNVLIRVTDTFRSDAPVRECHLKLNKAKEIKLQVDDLGKLLDTIYNRDAAQQALRQVRLQPNWLNSAQKEECKKVETALVTYDTIYRAFGRMYEEIEEIKGTCKENTAVFKQDDVRKVIQEYERKYAGLISQIPYMKRKIKRYSEEAPINVYRADRIKDQIIN